MRRRSPPRARAKPHPKFVSLLQAHEKALGSHWRGGRDESTFARKLRAQRLEYDAVMCRGQPVEPGEVVALAPITRRVVSA